MKLLLSCDLAGDQSRGVTHEDAYTTLDCFAEVAALGSPLRQSQGATTGCALGRVLIEIVGAEHRTGMFVLVIAGAILLLSLAVLVLRFGEPDQ